MLPAGPSSINTAGVYWAAVVLVGAVVVVAPAVVLDEPAPVVVDEGTVVVVVSLSCLMPSFTTDAMSPLGASSRYFCQAMRAAEVLPKLFWAMPSLKNNSGLLGSTEMALLRTVAAAE